LHNPVNDQGAMHIEFRRGDRHVYRFVAGEHLLIALHRDAAAPLFSLTPSAAVVWETLGQWTTTEQLVDRVVDSYDVLPDEALRDVVDLLAQLRSIGALETRERSS
jgi:hypothetical protein